MNEIENLWLCSVCNVPTLNHCPQCQQVYYCSREHQTQHWNSKHKFECQFLQKQKQQISQQQQQQQIQQPQIPEKLEQSLSKQSIKQYAQEDNHNLSRQSKNFDNNNINANIQNLHQKEYLKENNQNNLSQNQEQTIEKLIEDRRILRQHIVQLFGELNYGASIIPANKLVQVSNKIHKQQSKLESLFELFADQLLHVKILIKLDKIKSARESLIIIFNEMQNLLDEKRLLLKQDAIEIIRSGIPDHAISAEQKKLKKIVLLDLNKRCSLISLIGNLFYAIGDLKNCEQCYVKYVKLVEIILGGDAMETSNCYFLTGVFYLQHQQFFKALACFKRALQIRISKLGEKHECVGDCWYNIGIIYKQMGKRVKAIEILDQTLKLRKDLIGDVSLPSAQVLETLGKVYLEENDYKMALSRFQECYIIRKRILQNSKHPDQVRISLLIIHLFNCVKAQISSQDNNTKTQEMLENISEQIQNSIIDKNLHEYLSSGQQQQFDKMNDINQFFQINQSKKNINNNNDGNQNQIDQSSQRAYIEQQQLQQLAQQQQLLQQFQQQQLLLQQQRDRDSNQDFSHQVNKKQKQNQQESSQNEENSNPKKYLNLDSEVMALMSTDLLIALTALHEEVSEKQSEDPNFDPKYLILKSMFVQELSQSFIPYQKLKQKNPKIFDQKDPQVKEILDHYELQYAQNHKQIPQIEGGLYGMINLQNKQQQQQGNLQVQANQQQIQPIQKINDQNNQFQNKFNDQKQNNQILHNQNQHNQIQHNQKQHNQNYNNFEIYEEENSIDQTNLLQNQQKNNVPDIRKQSIQNQGNNSNSYKYSAQNVHNQGQQQLVKTDILDTVVSNNNIQNSKKKIVPPLNLQQNIQNQYQKSNPQQEIEDLKKNSSFKNNNNNFSQINQMPQNSDVISKKYDSKNSSNYNQFEDKHHEDLDEGSSQGQSVKDRAKQISNSSIQNAFNPNTKNPYYERIKNKAKTNTQEEENN